MRVNNKPKIAHSYNLVKSSLVKSSFLKVLKSILKPHTSLWANQSTVVFKVGLKHMRNIGSLEGGEETFSIQVDNITEHLKEVVHKLLSELEITEGHEGFHVGVDVLHITLKPDLVVSPHLLDAWHSMENSHE